MQLNIYPIHKEFEHLLDLYPPKSAKYFIPEWYKKHKNITRKDIIVEPNSIAHVKQCPAITDYLSTGIVIPAWSDILVYVNKDNEVRWEVSVGNALVYNHINWNWVQHHSENQIKDTPIQSIEGFGVLKLTCPYAFVTPDGYGIKVSDPFYHERKMLRILPGKIETDIHHEINFPFETDLPLDGQEYKLNVIKAGEPLFMVDVYKKETNTDVVINTYSDEFKHKYDRNNVQQFSTGTNWNRYKKGKLNETNNKK